MGRRRRFPDEDDARLWRTVTADITPLTRRDPPPKRAEQGKPLPPPSPPVRQAIAAAMPAPPPARPVRRKPPLLAHGETPDMDRRTAERLRRGQLPIDMRLDLHGMTREPAHHALSATLAAASSAGRRVVLVITGKGQGVLQSAVPRWLNEGDNRQRVLAFCHAQPKDGGSGALYVLLKRKR